MPKPLIIILSLFLTLQSFSQIVSMKNNTVKLHLVPIKANISNISVWAMFDNYKSITELSGGYTDLKISLKKKNGYTKFVIRRYYNGNIYYLMNFKIKM